MKESVYYVLELTLAKAPKKYFVGQRQNKTKLYIVFEVAANVPRIFLVFVQ